VRNTGPESSTELIGVCEQCRILREAFMEAIRMVMMLSERHTLAALDAVGSGGWHRCRSTGEVAKPSPNCVSNSGRTAADRKGREAGIPPWLDRPSTL